MAGGLVCGEADVAESTVEPSVVVSVDPSGGACSVSAMVLNGRAEDRGAHLRS